MSDKVDDASSCFRAFGKMNEHHFLPQVERLVHDGFHREAKLMRIRSKFALVSCVLIIGTFAIGEARPSLSRAASGLVGISLEIEPLENNRIQIKMIDNDGEPLIVDVERIDAKTIRVVDPSDGDIHEAAKFKFQR